MDELIFDKNEDWDKRVLCSDGACIGVIGLDGKCCVLKVGLLCGVINEISMHRIWMVLGRHRNRDIDPKQVSRCGYVFFAALQHIRRRD